MDKGQNSNKNEIINRIQPHKAEKAKNDSDDLKGANTKQNNEENSTDFDENGKFLIYNGNNNNNIETKENAQIFLNPDSKLDVNKKINEQNQKIQFLIEEFNKMKEENDKIKAESNKMREENNKMKEENEKKYNELKGELNKVKLDNKEISKVLGSIQMRDKAKTLLKHYVFLLDTNDNKIIAKEPNKKWEIISRKIKIFYDDYKNTKYCKAFFEIISKCAETLEQGNKDAHSVEIKYFQKDIDTIIKENNNNEFKNKIKLCFLLEIKVSKHFLCDSYDILEQIYENDMSLKLSRGNSIQNMFKK